jgi:hypothetical protein
MKGFRRMMKKAASPKAAWLIVPLVYAVALLLTSSVVGAQSLSLTNQRGNSTVVTRTNYDYAPAVMLDGKYRMWWCGHDPAYPGDSIMYSEAFEPGGPWSTPISVFQHGTPGSFDANHACDPSVIRVRGTYYMYYGGMDEAASQRTTQIGVASSSDGIHWTRLNGGQPIVRPFAPWLSGNYGAGQPSVAYVAPHYYMVYTDDTHSVTELKPGQWLMRATDPLFQSNVESMKANGFVLAPPGLDDRDIHHGFGAELNFSDILDRFVVVDHHVIEIHSWSFQVEQTLQLPTSPSTFCEQSGVARTPEGHLPPSRTDLTRVPVDVFYAKTPLAECLANGESSVWTYDLGWSGADIVSNQTISQLASAGRLGRVLEGFRVSTSGQPDALIMKGKRLRFAYEPVATLIVRNSIGVTSQAYAGVPIGPEFRVGATALSGPPGYPAAFVPGDGMKWLIGCQALIDRNSSSATSSNSQYFSLADAGELHCLQSTSAPFGFLDGASLVQNGLSVRGWSMDPDDPGASVRIPVRITQGGTQRNYSAGIANRYRVDVDANVQGADGYQGFDTTIWTTMPLGSSSVCASALSTDLGPDGDLGCKTVTNNAPSGWFDEASGGPSSLRVRGWTKDADTLDAALTVAVDVTGSARRYCAANIFRSDVGTHGFDCTLSANPGSATVCVRAFDSSGGGLVDIGMSCRSVVIP